MSSYRNQNSFHWLRFPRLADFSISATAKKIHCYPLPEIPEETIRHLLLDQVLPRCLAHQGKVMLHASAVRLEQGLILFIGESGAGKSTLAGNFHQVGHPAISDDCVWIKSGRKETVAVPSYGGLRLWTDSLDILFGAERDVYSMVHYSAKKRVRLRGTDELQIGSPIPVLALIMLTLPDEVPAPEIVLDKLSHREAFIALMKQSFHLNVMDLKRMKRHIECLGRIGPRVPAFRLSMPRDYNLLPAAREKILEAVL